MVLGKEKKYFYIFKFFYIGENGRYKKKIIKYVQAELMK